MIERKDEGSVVGLRIEHGSANALDLELTLTLVDHLDEAEADEEVRAVVLTGTGRIFSAGVDLFRLLEAGRPYLEKFLPALSRVVRRIHAFPRPIVAAINGHAIAGGCVLACACDLRLMASGDGRIGVPELLVGVPFPTSVLEVLRASVPAGRFRELILDGRTYGPQEALDRGLIDEVVEPDVLPARARERAERLASIRPEVYAITKRQLSDHDHPSNGVEAADREVLEAWSAPETRDSIRAYLERTLGKSRRD